MMIEQESARYAYLKSENNRKIARVAGAILYARAQTTHTTKKNKPTPPEFSINIV